MRPAMQADQWPTAALELAEQGRLATHSALNVEPLH
jgi:hypothetical protein